MREIGYRQRPATAYDAGEPAVLGDLVFHRHRPARHSPVAVGRERFRRQSRP